MSPFVLTAKHLKTKKRTLKRPLALPLLALSCAIHLLQLNARWLQYLAQNIGLDHKNSLVRERDHAQFRLLSKPAVGAGNPNLARPLTTQLQRCHEYSLRYQ